MNTHDKYELPPLPEPFTYTRPGETEGALYHAGHMQDFARSAIEADRQRRGAPSSLAEVWRLNADEAEAYGRQDVADTLRGCADEVETFDAPPPTETSKCEPVAWIYEDELPDNYPYEVMFPYSKVDGVRMFPVYAPQPAEPVKSTCKKCNGTGVESTRFHGVWPNGEECLEPIKCDQCDGFGTTSAAEPVKVPSAPHSPYSIDQDPAGIRGRASDAIRGALAFGAQGVNRPPEGHWLTEFWEIARSECDIRASTSVEHGVDTPDAQRWQKARALPRSWWRDAFNRIAAEGVTLDDLIDAETRRKLP